MRTLLLSRFFFSGQTTHVVSLARALDRLPEMTVGVATIGRGHPQAWEMYAKELTHAGVSAFRTTSAKALQACVRRFNPDVIHTHSSDLLPVSREVSRDLGVPLVFTCHGLGIPHQQPRIAEVDLVIAVGPRIQRELRTAGVHACALIGNGVDLERFRPTEKAGAFQIAYVGRVDAKKRKGLHELIAAVKEIPRARLMVASNDRPKFDEEDRLTTLGWVHDVAPLLAESHAVFGTGRAIREGMAAACVPFVLGERYTGMLRPTDGSAWLPLSGLDGETPSRGRIRLDLIRLIQDPTHWRALSAWSREYACAHFSLSDVAEQTAQLYQRVIAACPA